jgi:FkbM family methyltransferase
MGCFAMIGKIKIHLQSMFRSLGIEVGRLSRVPKFSFLGLKQLPIHTIIDVGANTGQFAKHIGRFFPNAQLYCFEPLPGPFQELSAWAQRERPGQVRAYNCALGEAAGTQEMFLHTEHSPSSSLLPTTQTAEALFPFQKEQVRVCIRVETLDKVLAGEHLRQDILIKLDVQGYEDRVIRGGSAIFSQAKACIVEVNLDALYSKQASFKEILLLLDGLGYRYVGNFDQVYGKDGHVMFFDALFTKIAEQDEH